MNKYLNTESKIIPIFSINESKILNNIYKIYNWNDTLNYFENYKKNDLKYGFQRILEYSWIAFLDDYKNNLNTILEIYKIYVKIQNIDLSENELKEKIRNFDPKKYNKKIYTNILE